MKHLIETTDPSGLPITEYDRIILASATNDVIVRGGVNNANILMLSETGYQLFGEKGDDGQINNYWVFEYTGTEKYNGKEYFKYSVSETEYILAPTRNITKVTFPFDDYYAAYEGKTHPLLDEGWDSLYGFTSVPENKILMKRRTDIGTNANGKDYVDLGLTSGTLWATMNVGATSETNYGSYFQWGDTVDKRNADCSWSSYKYCNGTADTTEENVKFTKYNALATYGENPDGKTTLDLEDDAARVNMGGDWRMPSAALMEELISETKSEWVANGKKFTSKTDPSKYIFIPASGVRAGSSFDFQGNCGGVWSSSLLTGNPYYAWRLYFDSGSVSTSSGYSRDYGYVARGVL